MAAGTPSPARGSGALRRARRWLAYGLAIAVIALAVLVGTASQLLPLLERHPDAVAAWLSERTGQPIAFDALNAEWTRRGPLLGLEGLRIGDAQAPLRVDQARLLVSIYSGLVPGRPLTELRLGGVVLVLSRDAAGRWQVDGLGTARQGDLDPQAALDALEGLGEIQVRDARLEVSIAEDERRWSIPRVDLRLRASGGRIRAGLLGFSDGALVPLVVIAELDRRSGDGRIHLRADGADLPRWAGTAGWAGVMPMAGRAGVSAWITLAGQRVVAVEGELRLGGLVLAAETAGRETLEVESVQLAGRWASDAGRWTLRLPEAGWRVDGVDHDLGGIWGQGDGDRLAVAIDRIDIEPGLRLLALSDRVPSALPGWLQGARPGGSLSGFELALDDARLAGGRAQVESLQVRPVDGAPGLAGVGGRLAFDADGAVLDLDGADWVFDWPEALQAPLTQQVRGQLAAWRVADGWALGTAGLTLRGEDYGAEVRGEARFVSGGGRPWLALALELEPGPLAAAQRFWFRNVMPPPAVDWLERALLGGHVEGGRALVVGDLDDWPFRDGSGVFDSAVEFADVELAFLDDWPAAQSIQGSAGFTASGMRLEVGGVLAGVPVQRAEGGIADWARPVLALQAAGDADAAALLALLRGTPLQGPWREQTASLQVQGPARAAVDLRVPLRRILGVTGVDGTVELRGVDASDDERGLDFTDVTGPLRFSRDGFAADALSVRLDGHPGRFGLAVGEATSDPAQLLEASLQGRFPIASLLARADALQGLTEQASGEADFDIALTVPAGAYAGGAAGPAMLRIGSDLVGVDLALPAPLRKRPRVALPLQVDLPLPVDAGELQVRLGGLLHFRGYLPADGAPGGMLALGQPAEPVRDRSRFDVLGQVAVLDVAGWAAVLREGLGDGAPGGGLELGTVDIGAGQLDLLDRAFIETRLRLQRDDEAMRLRIDGDELSGELVVPDQIDRGLVGRFERLHWPSGRQASGGTGTIDPAGIPPLDFQVEDLRFGEARLGRASLLTYPTPEGMQVERLQAESDDMRLDAVGTWSLIEGRAYSRFSIGFASDNLGQMLSSLGYAGIVDGGPTQADLVAGWVGSPAAFSLDAVEGSLSVDVGAGRILEVDPGAGRLLGLVSLAELPRRLSLDFSDFFQQGFGFNTIVGEFELGSGQARTDALRIDGPAALITVSGSTALQAQTYDQTIEVLPKTGGVLPVVGAITGGPAGAAIGAVAQAILNQPFRMAARVVYRVTGAWRSPDVEVVERGPPRTTAAPGDAARDPG